MSLIVPKGFPLACLSLKAHAELMRSRAAPGTPLHSALRSLIRSLNVVYGALSSEEEES